MAKEHLRHAMPAKMCMYCIASHRIYLSIQSPRLSLSLSPLSSLAPLSPSPSTPPNDSTSSSASNYD